MMHEILNAIFTVKDDQDQTTFMLMRMIDLLKSTPYSDYCRSGFVNAQTSKVLAKVVLDHWDSNDSIDI